MPKSCSKLPDAKPTAQVKALLKLIPTFRSEDEEREFWATVDSTEYFDWSTAQRVVFPKLSRSTETPG
jgi:hypothetical protein